MRIFCIGFACGALGMYLHFYLAGLIRTREEWKNRRK